MIDKPLRDIVNLLIYGGFLIGLCAACVTALTLEINGNADAHLRYVVWIGIATAGLYCGHRVIGLEKVAHIKTSVRFNIIRKYRKHIWIYFFVWTLLTTALFFSFGSLELLLWLVPGGSVAVGYILPFIPGGKRLRDLGWTKILMIGWSWGWLTAFIPTWLIAHEPLQMAIILGLERMLFIILITIPFEIRDMEVDRSVGLLTLPEKLGRKKTKRLVWMMGMGMVFLAMIPSFHYYNVAYFLTSVILFVLILAVNAYSWDTQDDYFFGGLTDGIMVLAIWIYTGFQFLL